MRNLWIASMALFLSPWAAPLVRAQSALPPEVARHGYADIIAYNGKVVSMDDTGLNENPGNVYEAIAVKGNKIIAVGTSARIRTMADSNTKSIDLGGKTLIPGIIESHVHLFGGGQLGTQMGLPTPHKGVNLTIQAARDMESTRLKIENGIKDAVEKVDPGDWVTVGVRPNRDEGVSSNRGVAWFAADKLETAERLDRISPENPVIVQGGIRGSLNTKAMEEAKAVMPDYLDFINQSTGDSDASTSGEVGSQEMAAIKWEIFYKDKPISLIAEMFRRVLEEAASHGVTTFSSRVPHPLVMDGFALLNREEKMPIRFASLYEVHRNPNNPEYTREFYKLTGNLTGLGNDYLWIHGVASVRWDTSFPMACLGDDVEAPPEIKARELCLEPGDMFWDTLQNALEAGWRLAGIHGLGSDGVRRFMQMVEMARQNTGRTVEDIRQLRLTVEHATVLGQVPDVMENLKKFGIIVSAGPPRLLRYPDYLRDYGEQMNPFLLPVKTWINSGIRVVGQNHSYRRIGYLWKVFMTREVGALEGVYKGGKVLPDEAVSRMTILKMWTNWASEYVLKEDKLGSLEVGKLADLLVLDKDYFTIPIDEIPNIVPQMTVVGGEVRYLGAGFARRQGMEPVGYQFPDGYSPWGNSPR